MPTRRSLRGVKKAARKKTGRNNANADDPSASAPAVPPNTGRLSVVAAAAARCQACPLWRLGRVTVFGEGNDRAKVLLVGEQPGDQEDRAGKPFVGPAGKLLDRALAEAGIDRTAVYVTNAVKHFKWESAGKRRLHKKPGAREIAACRPWLAKEIELVRPRLIVCLGATATLSIAGSQVKVTQQRGHQVQTEFGIPALITIHPSSLLRQPDREQAAREFASFVGDLKQMASFL